MVSITTNSTFYLFFSYMYMARIENIIIPSRINHKSLTLCLLTQLIHTKRSLDSWIPNTVIPCSNVQCLI